MQNTKFEILRAELELKKKELELNESQKSLWRSPLVIAILVAAIGAFANALVAFLNNNSEIKLAKAEAENSRILHMINDPDPNKVRENLKFLVGTGLIDVSSDAVVKISSYYDSIAPGSGPTGGESKSKFELPEGLHVAFSNELPVGIFVSELSQCNATIVEPDLIALPYFCVANNKTGKFYYRETVTSTKIGKVNSKLKASDTTIVFLSLSNELAINFELADLATEEIELDDKLHLIFIDPRKPTNALFARCRVTKVNEDNFHHDCPSAPGSAGGLLRNIETGQIVGLHTGTIEGLGTTRGIAEKLLQNDL